MGRKKEGVYKAQQPVGRTERKGVSGGKGQDRAREGRAGKGEGKAGAGGEESQEREERRRSVSSLQSGCPSIHPVRSRLFYGASLMDLSSIFPPRCVTACSMAAMQRKHIHVTKTCHDQPRRPGHCLFYG